MDNKKEKDVILIFLEKNEKVKCTFPKVVFDEIEEKLKQAMKTGNNFFVDDYCDSFLEYGDDFLAVLNGSKIVGYSF